MTALQFVAAASSPRPPAHYAFEYTQYYLPDGEAMKRAMKGLPPDEAEYVRTTYNWLIGLGDAEAKRIARKCGVTY